MSCRGINRSGLLGQRFIGDSVLDARAQSEDVPDADFAKHPQKGNACLEKAEVLWRFQINPRRCYPRHVNTHIRMKGQDLLPRRFLECSTQPKQVARGGQVRRNRFTGNDQAGNLMSARPSTTNKGRTDEASRARQQNVHEAARSGRVLSRSESMDSAKGHLIPTCGSLQRIPRANSEK